ncbi:MAG: DUF2206 domain-containing protein [Bacteroidota bacterium]
MINKFKRLLELDFVYWMGFSIFGILVYGLGINYILPKLGIYNPLSNQYIWPIYFIFVLTLIQLLTKIKIIFKDDLYFWTLRLLILLNPMLAVFGVYYLDNTGDGRLAMVSVGFTCLVFLLTIFKKNLGEETIKLSIYSSALSLILANSLRSQYLVGYDIHQEYLVFRLTNLHNLWDINALRDAYNACLSITILPTIIRNLLGIPPLTVYKLIFPLIFALIPVIVYQIGTRITNKTIAYAGAFAFLLQAQYISQLPALMRQGIAFLFFALIIDVLIRSNINQKYRDITLLIFGSGMILSHYSTTYITLSLLILAKVINVLFNKFWPNKKKIRALSYKTTIILLFITIFWNVLITDTAGGLIQTIIKMTDNIGNTFSLENKSDLVKDIFYQQSDNATAVIDYSNKSLRSISNPQYYEGYEIFPVSLYTGKPMLISDSFTIYFYVLIPWFFRLSIVVGFVFLLIKEFKNKQSYMIISIVFSMFVITFCFVLLPYVSINYNFERLFQQMLVLLAPICAIGLMTIFKVIRKVPVSIPITIFLLSYIIKTTGFINHVLYNSSTWMFNNSGEQYYRYFSAVGEISGINWFEKNTKSNILLYADNYSKLRFVAFSDQKFSYISTQINPPVIDKYSYVFSGLAGTKADTVFSKVDNQALEYSFPNKFLSETKNTIYSNSIARIYR